MNIKFYTTTALALLAIGLTACDEKVESKTVERSTVDGTEITTTTTKEVTTESDGDTQTEIEKTRSVDPEGLMNERTTTQELESETDYSD